MLFGQRCFLDGGTLWDYSLFQRRVVVPSSSFLSQSVRLEFGSRAKRSVLDGVFMPSSLSPGSASCVDPLLRGTCRRFTFSRGLILLGSFGVLAFLFSAIVPDDDGFQQECLRSRRLVLRLIHQTKRLSQSKTTKPVQTISQPGIRPSLFQGHQFASFLGDGSLLEPQTLSLTVRAPRPPPLPS
jgi:hypothetical protein